MLFGKKKIMSATVNTFSSLNSIFKESYPKKVVDSAMSTKKKQNTRFDNLKKYIKGK